MPRRRPFELSYDEATRNQLRAIQVKYHPLIRMQIQAIGVKRGDRLFVGGEEVEL
jgi:hypothetical protein